MGFDKISYNNDFNRQSYDRLGVLVPKGKGKIVKDFAKAQGKSVSQLIVDALETQYKLDLSKANGG